MALILSLNLGIKQVVHNFANHVETVHDCSTHDKDGNTILAIDKEHHHCDYLTDLLSPFDIVIPNAISLTIPKPKFQEFFNSPYFIYPNDDVYSFQLRGPPLV